MPIIEEANKKDGDDVVSVEKVEIQHKHSFHFKELYKMMHDYFEDYEYKSENGSDDYENYYMERYHEGGMREVRYYWHLYKKPSQLEAEDKPMVTFHVGLLVRALGVKDVEVAYGSKKVKVQDGEISIIITTEMLVRYSFLKKHWLGKLLFDFYKKRWYKSYHEQFKKQLYGETYHLVNTIKRWLNWYQYSLVQKPLRPSIGGYKAKPEFEK